MLNEPVAVTLLVVDALESQGVPYVIGGSFASSIHGAYRLTADSDLVADLKTEHVESFVRPLSGEFYVDADSIREAIRTRRSFSVLHLETMFKIDVFIPKPRAFDRVQLERRVKQVVSADPERTAYVCTAEDTILAKLEWYRLGGEVSDRQWIDVQNVLKAQAGRLDMTYLRQMAAALDIADLLEDALAEVNRPADVNGQSEEKS